MSFYEKVAELKKYIENAGYILVDGSGAPHCWTEIEIGENSDISSIAKKINQEAQKAQEEQEASGLMFVYKCENKTTFCYDFAYIDAKAKYTLPKLISFSERVVELKKYIKNAGYILVDGCEIPLVWNKIEIGENSDISSIAKKIKQEAQKAQEEQEASGLMFVYKCENETTFCYDFAYINSKAKYTLPELMPFSERVIKLQKHMENAGYVLYDGRRMPLDWRKLDFGESSDISSIAKKIEQEAKEESAYVFVSGGERDSFFWYELIQKKYWLESTD